MKAPGQYDAVIVGSGPNGLAAAITLAREGLSVLVLEAREHIGGGVRSSELTMPGFVHDICSAVYPLGVGSPFFRSLPLTDYGLRWIYPPLPLAHPLDDGTAAVLARSIAATCETLGADAAAWRSLFAPAVAKWEELISDVLLPPHFPQHPLTLARFGWHAIRSARWVAERQFKGKPARALFGGLAAHSILALERTATASFGLFLGVLGHAVGWPIVAGGAQQLSEALAGYLRSLGGEIRTHMPVQSLDDLPASRVVLLDISPRQFVTMAGGKLCGRRRRKLERFRYGPGVFKIDWAMDGPIPWTAPACAQASTIHVGGAFEEIARSEAATARGEIVERPFTLVAQPSLFDPTRAPTGKHTAWAYCHVPHGSVTDRREAIEAQIERFAPGFRDRILACATLSTAQLETYNPNYIGGDIAGGSNDIAQLLTRPFAQWVPYSTTLPGVYLCSASTPPGGGVHGMCGYNAAQTVLKRELRRVPSSGTKRSS